MVNFETWLTDIDAVIQIRTLATGEMEWSPWARLSAEGVGVFVGRGGEEEEAVEDGVAEGAVTWIAQVSVDSQHVTLLPTTVSVIRYMMTLVYWELAYILQSR